MKRLLLYIFIGGAALQGVLAEKWEPATHECSLEFPEGGWTFQPGREIEHGQIILTASNRERTKDVNVVRYEVAASMSVQDSRFAQGMKNGFSNTGGQMVSDGFTNINGRVAYWFAGESFVNGKKISTLRYAFSESGILFQVLAESVGGLPQNDTELSTILGSFQIHADALPVVTSSSRSDTLAYRIGQITGILLVLIFGGGIVRWLVRKRA